MTENATDGCLISDESKKRLVEESNRCVSCGLCLPHCPTYRLLQTEADSPRGRIAIINGVATERIPLNDKFILHLDRCLTCRACESVCPNKVAYGRLADEARTMIRAAVLRQPQQHGKGQSGQSHFFSRLLAAWITQPARLERLRGVLYLLQKSGALGLLRRFNFWHRAIVDRLLRQLPRIVFPVLLPNAIPKKNRFFSRGWQSFYPAEGEEKGRVGLFLGCIARITDAETLNASIFVLNRAGYSVCIPERQTCCGALYQHAGEPERADALMQLNLDAFSTSGVTTVITTASGCGVQLTESIESRAMEQNGSGKAASFQIVDISRFLMETVDWDTMAIAPLQKVIAVHDPCSLCHVLHDQAYPYQLLKAIPQVKVLPLADNGQCCGAAGKYCIEQPDLADQLLEGKINALTQSGAQLLVTSNVGCSMHLASGLRDLDAPVDVLHPVTLLARQMGMR